MARERARRRDRRNSLWGAFAPALEWMEADVPVLHADGVALLEDCLSQLSARARLTEAYSIGAAAELMECLT